jgi:phosphatidylglycerol---prolipoprotein diacylglyceryl transferase
VHPVLFFLGRIPIRAYGAFVGAALVAGMSMVVRYGRRNGLPGDRLLDATYAGVVAGLVGGRVMYVLVHLGDFRADPMAALRVWEGGMMYFGGLVLGVIVGCLAAHRAGLSIWRSADCIAPAIGAGQAVGRVACLAAGCCYGKVCSWPIAISFHDHLAAIPPDLLGRSLIPTQVLQMGEGLFLWVLGAWMFRRKTWDGQAFLYTFAAAGVTRALLEELRGDSARGFLLPSILGDSMPSSRVVGVAMVMVALGIAAAKTIRARSTPATPATAP